VSRRGNRNRYRQGGTVAVKARTMPPGTVTLTGDQLTAIMTAQQRAGQLAEPLPRPPQWSGDPFAPGTPLRPAPINKMRPQTGRAEPRLFELPLSTNINIGTAPFVPWRVLREAADMPLFRKCIERRKGICALDFTVTVDPRAVSREAALSGSYEKDIEAALRRQYTPDIARISDWLEVPDRENGYDWAQWTGQLMEQRLKYDATAVYGRYSYGGDLLSLWVLDGSTIKPLLNEYGGRPQAPAPAYQQILYGYPRGEFTRGDTDPVTVTVAGPGGAKMETTPGFASDELLYERTIIREATPYGMSACEIALMDGILYLRRQGWMIAEYTEGVMPDAFIKVDGATDWDVTQWEIWQKALNDHLGGNTPERMKFPLFPPGTEPVQAAGIAERYKPDYDLYIVKLIAGDFGLTATEVGFPEVGSLGASFHEGEEDVLNRVTRRPDAEWVSRIVTKLAQRHLGMPKALKVQILGLESEDEAAADAVAQNRTDSARATLNEDRARRGEPPYDFAEADMPMLVTGRGVVFLEGASQLAPPGTLIEPATVKPGDPGDSSSGMPGGTPEPGAAPAGSAAAAADGRKPAAKGTAAADVAAYSRWALRARPGSRFECNALTAAAAPAVAPQMAADRRVVFKAVPKALAGRGLAGTGTRIS
jgi:hypothetical protein